MIRAVGGPTPGTARVREWPSGQRRQLWTAALKLGRSTKSKPGAIVCRGWLPGILVFHRAGRRPTPARRPTRVARNVRHERLGRSAALECATSVRDALVAAVAAPSWTVEVAAGAAAA